uniref:Putative beta beta-carotene n=1 Tax=Ixodes ricinus TaxID=34613 RepID=A0A131Y215_IXORI
MEGDADQTEGKDSPWLFTDLLGRSCLEEVEAPLRGRVTGVFPSWLRGRLLRNGPGLNFVGPDRYQHAFDGLSLLRQFSVDNGEVSYRNRFLRSQAYVRNRKANRIVVAEFGTAAHPDPCAGVFERLASVFTPTMTDNALVNVMPIGDEFYAMTETPYVHRVDPGTLETLSREDLSRLVAVHTTTAHPHVDPEDRSTFNVGTQMGSRPAFVLIRFPPSVECPDGSTSLREARVVGRIPMQSRFFPSYIHSFAMTENWLVVLEQSLVLSVPKLFLARAVGTSYADTLSFDPNKKTRFHVMDKRTGELFPVVFEAAPFFTFHHVNAYERDREIVVDLCAFDDDAVIRNLRFAHPRPKKNDGLASVRRFVLPLDRAVKSPALVESRVLSLELDGLALRAELPRINDRFNGKPYRFAYLVGHSNGPAEEWFVSKLNVESGRWVRWKRPGWVPSEPVFIPRPGATDEDDGVVVFSLLDAKDEKKLSFVALDARNFEEIARAEFETPSANPADFHGWFVSE